jgi:glucose-6-phosphate isomerase
MLDEIKLDINNMFARRLGGSHGLTEEMLKKHEPELIQATANVRNSSPGFLKLPYEQDEIVADILRTVDKLRGKFDNFIVLGIGGSALGNIALQTALNHPYYNYRDDIRLDRPRLFVSDNVDPLQFLSLLETLDLKRTVFNVISKSGGTAETMSQFLIARQKMVEAVGEERLAEHFIATTSEDSGYLIEISRREGLKTFFIPEDVGGRFSVLTPVGLLSAAFCGIDIKKLLEGARAIDERCRTRNIWKNPALLNALLNYLAYYQGKIITVMMPYSYSLKDIADWFRQLWAESLGKEYDRGHNIVNIGPTPVKALGTTDQHSQLQLYMEGPYDKVISFIEVEDYGFRLEIPGVYDDLDGVSYFGGHSLNELIKTEKQATELALSKRGRMNNTIILPRINEYTIGQLIFMLELQTAIIGELFNIDTFNQPGVELSKHYTYGVLGRKGYEDKAREFKNRPEKDASLIL